MLDLTKGYWQVPVVDKDRPKMAFTNPFGVYQFTRMPFVLQYAPATFQRMMDRLLDRLREFASAYLDDLIVFSQSWRGHLRHLDAEAKGGGAYCKVRKVPVRDAAMQLSGACGWWRRGEGRGVQDRGSREKRTSEDAGGEDVPWPENVLPPVRSRLLNMAAPLTDIIRKTQQNQDARFHEGVCSTDGCIRPRGGGSAEPASGGR